MTHIVEKLCGESVSKSFVFSLTQKLDPIMNEWSKRPLNVTFYPFLFVDVMYIKVREWPRVVSKAVYLATAIAEKDNRKILGLSVDHEESYESWRNFLQLLKSRGIQPPKLVICDAHKGLKKAIQREFIGTSRKGCNVHFKRNILKIIQERFTRNSYND